MSMSVASLNSVVRGITQVGLFEHFHKMEQGLTKARPKVSVNTGFIQMMMMHATLPRAVGTFEKLTKRDLSIVSLFSYMPLVVAAIDAKNPSNVVVRKIVSVIHPNIGKIVQLAVVTSVIAGFALGQSAFAVGFLAIYGINRLLDKGCLGKRTVRVIKPILFAVNVYSLILIGGYLATSMACFLVATKILKTCGCIASGSRIDLVSKTVLQWTNVLLVLSNANFYVSALICASLAFTIYQSYASKQEQQQQQKLIEASESLKGKTTLETLENIEQIKWTVNFDHIHEEWQKEVPIPKEDCTEQFLKLHFEDNFYFHDLRDTLFEHNFVVRNGDEAAFIRQRIRDNLAQNKDPEISNMMKYISQQVVKGDRAFLAIITKSLMLDLSLYEGDEFAEQVRSTFAFIAMRDDTLPLPVRILAYLREKRKSMLHDLYKPFAPNLAGEGIFSFPQLLRFSGHHFGLGNGAHQSLSVTQMRYMFLSDYREFFEISNDHLTNLRNIFFCLHTEIQNPTKHWVLKWLSRQDPTKILEVDIQPTGEKIAKNWRMIGLLESGVFFKKLPSPESEAKAKASY